jgi:azurin
MPIWNRTQRRFWKLSGLAVCIALLIACGGAPGTAQPPASTSAAASDQAAATPDPDETAVPTPDDKPAPTDPAGTVSLEIGTASGAAEFRYDKETLEVPAGSRIKLKFTNNTNPKDEVGHNWVLVQPGQEESVVANGIAAGDDKDWVNSDDPGIIAHTRLIEGGQSNTIRFDAPPPGTYTYLCTFPEHYAGGQKGTLTVK